MNENDIATAIIECAYKVYSAIGPGVLESTYEALLVHELKKNGIESRRQVPLPIVYEELELEAGYRIDLIAGGLVVVEIKAIEALAPVHFKQMLTYLRLSGLKLGILINFDVAVLKDGIKRVINGKIE